MFSDLMRSPHLDANIAASESFCESELTNLEFITYDWTNPTVPLQLLDSVWDNIICSDVLYEMKAHDYLLSLLSKLKFKRLVISYKKRDVEELTFFDKLAAFCKLQLFVLPEDECSPPCTRNLTGVSLQGLFCVMATPLL